MKVYNYIYKCDDKERLKLINNTYDYLKCCVDINFIREYLTLVKNSVDVFEVYYCEAEIMKIEHIDIVYFRSIFKDCCGKIHEIRCAYNIANRDDKRYVENIYEIKGQSK